MKVLICSLQVTTGASKGHLHPAIELGIEMQKRGHAAAILPLPSPLSDADRMQIQRCGLEILEPPSLPDGLPLPPHELARLAKHPDTAALAYHSFLVAPLVHQFENIVAIIHDYQPDIIVYDLLVYAAPLAARLLGIPEIGFCAGLKLIAPIAFTRTYQNIAQQLMPDINQFMRRFALDAEFHHLELLSTSHQLVFTPREFIPDDTHLPRGTVLTGSLPISDTRTETSTFNINKPFVLLCFGSVLDPANYPELSNIILETAKEFNLHVILTTRQPQRFASYHVTAAEYLPLPQLMSQAALFIHHGGANTFSESLTLGVPQLLIPLTTDQPIQAEYLTQSGAGMAISPHELTKENCYQAFQTLLDLTHPLHHQRRSIQSIFQHSKGVVHACDLIEDTALMKEAV